ncbi:MAG: polysaccharide deacetylase family protein [Bacteroidia bacterium]|nr:polysaccharide deacetylase family protein [Bacteroidia bacterium]
MFQVRTVLRDAAVNLLSIGRSINNSSGWIRFPYYHHVFSDERRGFVRQLEYLRNYGEFISLDTAVSMMEDGQVIDGRYFCLTFDDGIRCCYDEVTPLLVERSIPAAFFIVTDYTVEEPGRRICRPLYLEATYDYEYLTWPECREMIRAGMTVGSHTCSHVRLAALTGDEVRRQLIESKRMIEQNLDIECRHFACPWGGVNRDFDPKQDVKTAKDAGYRSFLTTRRGKNTNASSPFAIRRDNMYANWSTCQLRYFLSL